MLGVQCGGVELVRSRINVQGLMHTPGFYFSMDLFVYNLCTPHFHSTTVPLPRQLTAKPFPSPAREAQIINIKNKKKEPGLKIAAKARGKICLRRVSW